MFLRVEKDVEVGKMEALINHLLNLFLSFGREFATINIFAFFGVVVNLLAALISISLILLIWGHIVLQEWVENLFNDSSHECLVLAITNSPDERI